MYQTPELKRYGSLEERTLTGFEGTSDNMGHPGVPGSGDGSGCVLLPNGVFCPAQS